MTLALQPLLMLLLNLTSLNKPHQMRPHQQLVLLTLAYLEYIRSREWEHSGKITSQVPFTRLEPCTINDHLQTIHKSVVPSHLNSDQVDEERHLMMFDFPFAV